MHFTHLAVFLGFTASTFAAECYDYKGGNWAKSGSSRDTAAWAIRQSICGSCSGGCVVDKGQGAWGSQSHVNDGSGGFGGYGSCWDAMDNIISQCTRQGWAGGTWTSNGAQFQIGTS